MHARRLGVLVLAVLAAPGVGQEPPSSAPATPATPASAPAALRAEGALEDGRRAGAWVLYYSDGAVAARGQYVNGRLHGPWEALWPDGKPRARGKYRLGFRDGAWKAWRADGALDAAESGEFEVATDKWPEGELRAAIERRAGEPNGRATAHWKDGTPAFEGAYRAGLREGNWRWRHPDGSLDREFLSGWYERGAWREPLREAADDELLPQERPARSAGAAPRTVGLFKFARGEITDADARALEQRLISSAHMSEAERANARAELAARGRAIAPLAWNAWLESARRPEPDLALQQHCQDVLAAALELGADPLLAAPAGDAASSVRALQRWSVLLRATNVGAELGANAEDAAWRAERTPSARNTRVAALVANWLGLPSGGPGGPGAARQS
ncbi:MAG: hypothetical protein EPO68_15305, partial [Planctomycetota bacterium]